MQVVCRVKAEPRRLSQEKYELRTRGALLAYKLQGRQTNWQRLDRVLRADNTGPGGKKRKRGRKIKQVSRSITLHRGRGVVCVA